MQPKTWGVVGTRGAIVFGGDGFAQLASEKKRVCNPKPLSKEW